MKHRLSRPCYDKMHRCPGWAGGGTRSAKTRQCPSAGYVSIDYERPLWRWRFHHCNKCNVVVWPYVTRWLDPGWWRWQVNFGARMRNLEEWVAMQWGYFFHQQTNENLDYCQCGESWPCAFRRRWDRWRTYEHE